jgi:hypothetical protein
MDYFLVEGKIKIEYPEIEGFLKEEIRFVEADSPHEAEEKFCNHFENKSVTGIQFLKVEYCEAHGIIR